MIPPWRTGNISGSRGREYLQPKQQIIFGFSIGQGLRVTSTTGPSLISVKDSRINETDLLRGIKEMKLTLMNTQLLSIPEINRKPTKRHLEC